MHIDARLAPAESLLAMRTRYRDEARVQIVHDSIHRREGWARSYALGTESVVFGFGSVAVEGPWKGRPTVFEFYVMPAHRDRSFDAFEALLRAGDARFMEVQSNQQLIAAMLPVYGEEIASEATVFSDLLETALPAAGASLRCVTARDEIIASLERRQGGGEWVLDWKGTPVGKGGILFHYNRPYGDVYYEIEAPFRRRGFGSYFAQELKRACYDLGAIPAARCNTTNLASRRTLLKAGFVPVGHILTARVKSGFLGQDAMTADRPIDSGQVGGDG